MEMTVSEIAERLRGTVVGDGCVRITGVNGIKEAAPGDLTFLADERYRAFLEKTKASAILVPRGMAPGGCAVIQVDNPFLSFYTLLPAFRPAASASVTGHHPTAVVEPGAVLGAGVALGAHAYVGEGAQLGERVVLYPGVYIGPRTRIGADTVLYPNVVVREDVTVGARCILHGGAVIGADGFGFVPHNGVHAKVPQIGTVVIGDDVEIGANSAVDRATFGATVVGRGTKIDNLVQVAHNVLIGEHCTISGSTGIAGSAVIGNRVTVAAQAGIAGHLTVGDGAIVAGRAGVTKSVPAGRVVSGFPARDHELEKRVLASMRHLPDAIKRLHELERRMAELEKGTDGQTANDCE